MNFRTINIGLTVHNAIETGRLNLDESDDAVLQRLLCRQSGVNPENDIHKHAYRSWSGDGVILPHGTRIRMLYNKVLTLGSINDGYWQIGDNTFNSPSGAASSAARTKAGRRTSLDGWIYWYVQRPSDTDFITLSSLRVTSK